MKDKLEAYLKIKQPLIWIHTRDIGNTLDKVLQTIDSCGVWTTNELLTIANKKVIKRLPLSWTELNNQIYQNRGNLPPVIVFFNFKDFLNQPPVLTQCILLAQYYLISNGMSFIFIETTKNIPPEIEPYIAYLEDPLPNRKEIFETLRRVVQSVDDKVNTFIPKEITEILLGMTIPQVEKAAFYSLLVKRSIDYDIMKKFKEELLKETEVLSLVEPPDISQVGGLNNVKNWARLRKYAFDVEIARKFSLETPRGILLVGIPGTGKTLITQAIASMWNLPLILMDISAIFQKYVGESEERMRNTLKLLETINRAVVQIDEIDKSLGGSDKHEVTLRIIGSLLTWMSQHKSQICIAATANDISALPPHLLRKGRFDEIFFVDFPSKEDVKQIVRIHLAKRNLNVDSETLARIVEICYKRHFTGAEIEQAIKESLFLAVEDGEWQLKHFEKAAESLAAFYDTNRQYVENLRFWARENKIVPAGSFEAEELAFQRKIK